MTRQGSVAAVQIMPAEAQALNAWISTARDLVHQRREIDWQLADHIASGRGQFGEQLQFDMLAQTLGLEPKRLKEAERVALAFPQHLRACDVPVEVHAYIAALPEDRRLLTLQQASREQWGAKEARTVVTQHKQQAAMFEDNDPERLATLIYRAWNNAGPEIRQHAWPILQTAANKGFAIVDEEEVVG